MEQEELKRKLMGLWEKTTHSSKELLAALFDYYFNIEFIEYKESEGRIISALWGIPYNFGYGNKILKGLYLIPMSSEEGFKKKGHLSELLDAINRKASDIFDFTFLIPSTELLADYYGTKGYLSSFYILEERFTPLHNFKNDYFLTLSDSDDRLRGLKEKLFDTINVVTLAETPAGFKDEIIRFIREIERQSTKSINICHTEKDLDYLLQDSTVRNLQVFVAYDQDGKINGVSFVSKADIKRIKIVACYISDICSYYAILEYVRRHYQDYSISVNTFDSKYQTHSLIQQTYASANPEGGDLDNTLSTVEIPFNYNRLLQPLGMVKLLRFDNIMNYIAETRSDVDFKLHIRDLKLSDDDKSDMNVFRIKNGACHIEAYENHKHDRSILSLSVKEISELLLRKNDSGNLIMEAFGIPRLDLQLRLLPC